ncbi:MAG: DUF4197 domain-containing protein [Desulfobacteraceae bacterium]|nr:MAG: DUF4197 domain-containing protein [Desulfobacteraceae bacterium]
MKNRLFLTAKLLVCALFFTLCASCETDQLSGILKDLQKPKGLGEEEIIAGLKQALEIGTKNSVDVVSVLDGYYKNQKIKIPLPQEWQKIESTLRKVGLGSKMDEFIVSMNRAAEQAAPKAKSIFWDAIKTMRFEDAKKILKGRENEATLFFKDRTSATLTELFKPMVHNVMSDVGVTRLYQDLDNKMSKIPFLDAQRFDLDQYVTAKALDGLFLMVAEEEKKIRENPVARVTELLKRVFGSKE